MPANDRVNFAIPAFHMRYECNGWSSSSHFWPGTKNYSIERQKERGSQMTITPLHQPQAPCIQVSPGEKNKPAHVQVTITWVIHSQIWSCLVEGLQHVSYNQSITKHSGFQIFLFIINHTVILIRYIFRHIHSNFSRRQSQKANSGSKNVLLHTTFFCSQRLIYTHINDVWDDKNSALLHHH